MKKPRKVKGKTIAKTPGCARSGRRVIVDSKTPKNPKNRRSN